MIGPGSKQASGGNENQAEAGSGTQIVVMMQGKINQKRHIGHQAEVDI